MDEHIDIHNMEKHLVDEYRNELGRCDAGNVKVHSDRALMLKQTLLLIEIKHKLNRLLEELTK